MRSDSFYHCICGRISRWGWSFYAADYLRLISSTEKAAALAIVATIGLGVRIEAALLCLLAVVLPLTLADVVMSTKLVPTMICLGGASCYCLYNRLTMGQWNLDSTTRFNLRVARLGLADPAAPISTLMRNAVRTYNYTGATAEPVLALKEKPRSRVINQFFSRLKTLLGAETFVSQNLLQNNRAGYTNPQDLHHSSWGGWALRYGFTLSYMATLLVLPFAPFALTGLLICATLVYAGVQTRSRYRMVLLPLMSVVFGMGTIELVRDPAGVGLVFSAVAAAAFVTLLWFSEAQIERQV